MKLRTYILFIFGMFEDHEDIEYFCTEVLDESPVIKQVRFIIENSENIIVIFDSSDEYKTIAEELFPVLCNENIRFYFIFDRDSMITAHIPPEVKDYIFKPITDRMVISLDYEKKKRNYDLDELLDKIDKFGIESLSMDEKKFLDNFEK